PDSTAGYLTLLFGDGALAADGTFEQILADSGRFAADLGGRLRDRVYFDAVPALATAVASRRTASETPSEDDLAAAYTQTLTVLFRLLFIAYAEDKDLLPYRTNSRYAHHALKTLAQDLTERSHAGTVTFDAEATDLWQDMRALWQAVDQGNDDWGVPAYDGGLFSADAAVNPAGGALNAMRLTNGELGPALRALLVDEGDPGVFGPVDFRSLSVREFGTIYEGLLESRLAVAPCDLTVDAKGTYVPVTRTRDEVLFREGDVYFHDRSGARKSSGSYFTKPFAVEHLLDHALEPALDDHLRRLVDLLDAGDEAAAAEAFFDFRCVDLAMGSGHFLVAAVDRIEARLSAMLALRPIPTVTAELERLRAAAFEALGDLGDGVEIETTSLLRRQVARRCVYGVDLNPISVELARLAMWIHTFVPGLPLSFLDHSLVVGNSLTGIGTLEEAERVLEPDLGDGQLSVFHDQITGFLERAESSLHRLARTTEATASEVKEARAAQVEALAAVEPARQLFDRLVAARLGDATVPSGIDEVELAQWATAAADVEAPPSLQALHFPIAFPEVFLRQRPGFDCILGNPPWEEATVEELGWWALRFPGLRSKPVGAQRREIRQHRLERPDLVEDLEGAVEDASRLRKLLLAGPYPGMGSGDPDLYKAFCWRFWQLVREGGAIGVVLPRSALSAAGSAPWRQAVLGRGAFDVTVLKNSKGWVFDDVTPQYTVSLVALRAGVDHSGLVRLRGPFGSPSVYDAGMRSKAAEFPVEEFRSWSEGASFPLLPSADSARVFMKLRRHPRLDKQRER
ncbi:MAG: hypothetical protein M3423_08360, partial [Actinomycetota bacterium]|nr:hypothetical protein [Actinomycetota bacterium]